MLDHDQARSAIVPHLAALGLLLALAACGSDSPGTGPDPDPDPDPGPVDTEPDLECGLPGYPCAWSDVSTAIVDRTLALADEGLAMLGEGSTSADVLAWLDGQDDVVEVQGDELALRFRVEDGRGMWIFREGATSSGPGPDAARAGPSPSRTGPARHIVGDAPAKKALVLSPHLWEFGDEWDDGPQIAAILEGTRGYEGGVVYRKNETETSTEVGPAAFTDWDEFDVVHYTGHGRRVCDLTGCRATLQIGVVSTVIPGEGSETAKILQLDEMGLELVIGEKTGNKYVAIAADFFREHYPSGLDETLVYLAGCQTLGPQAVDLAAALQGGTSVILGWSETVYADDGIAAAQAFYADLSERGYPVQVAYERLDELQAGDAASEGKVPHLTLMPRPDGEDLHIRELVTVLNPHSGSELTESPTVSIVGDADDGNPDAAPFAVRIEGILEDFAGEMTVFVTVDGVAADPIPLAEGVKNEEDAWIVEGEVQLPYDLTDDRAVSVEARTTLHSGGESTHEATAVLTGSTPIMGYEWEFIATQSTYWTGGIPHTPYTASAVLTLEFAPGQEPDDPTPEYILTGGTVTWDYSHTYYDCVFSSAVEVFEVTDEMTVGSTIEFDTTTDPVSYTGYVRTFGPLFPTTSMCGDQSSTRQHRADNNWVRVRSDEPRPISADGMSFSGTYFIINEFTGYAFVWESNYTATRVR